MSIINPEYFEPPHPDPECLPCPFCGGVAELRVVLEQWFQVRCHRCRASSRSFPRMATAREFWNRRTPAGGGGGGDE